MRNLPEGGLTLSKHAEMRCQQRCIGKKVIDLIYQYGKREHTREGGLSFSMDKRSRKSLQKAEGSGSYKELESQLDIYIIVNDSTVITVAWRNRRPHF